MKFWANELHLNEMNSCSNLRWKFEALRYKAKDLLKFFLGNKYYTWLYLLWYSCNWVATEKRNEQLSAEKSREASGIFKETVSLSPKGLHHVWNRRGWDLTEHLFFCHLLLFSAEGHWPTMALQSPSQTHST